MRRRRRHSATTAAATGLATGRESHVAKIAENPSGSSPDRNSAQAMTRTVYKRLHFDASVPGAWSTLATKPETKRVAVRSAASDALPAAGMIRRFAPERRCAGRRRLAAIQGVKRMRPVIPLAHQIPLTRVPLSSTGRTTPSNGVRIDGRQQKPLVTHRASRWKR